MNQAQQKQ